MTAGTRSIRGFRGWGWAAALLALALALAGALAPDATGKGTAEGGPIVAPKAGATRAASPVRIAVRIPWGAERLRVELNSYPITREFERAEIGRGNRRARRPFPVERSRNGASR